MKLLDKLLMPSFLWIQVEISSFCNAECFYCPHTIYRKTWKNRNLSLHEFKKIVPFLEKTKLLYLQGWGEPFCNPSFFDFVEIGKKKGCKIGTTTNAMLIEASHLEKIIELEMDFISFSLTGIKTNDLLRKGTSIKKVLKIIESLNVLKDKKGVKKPQINIAYMLLKSNFNEIDNITEEFKNKGIEQVVISLLDFIPEISIKSESLVPQTEKEFIKLRDKLLETVQRGEEKGLSVSFNLSHPNRIRHTCSEKPLNAIFINCLGNVSPCVFTGIPAKEPTTLCFGNINSDSLLKIWRSTAYKNFRGKHSSENKPYVCKDCPKIRIS